MVAPCHADCAGVVLVTDPVRKAADIASDLVVMADALDGLPRSLRSVMREAATALRAALAADTPTPEYERGFSAGILDERGRWEAGCPEPAPTTDGDDDGK